jgi:steroid delta-isomerase-like uncharacterized protein
MDAEQIAAATTEAFNAHDEAAMRAHYTDDVVFEAPGGVRLEGPDAVTGYAMSWLRAFPDARLNVLRRAAAGDSVTQEFVFEGTHDETLQGPGGDIPATHRRLSGRGVQVMRIRDGKICEEHLYFDQVDVMTQLGLMPEPART